MSRPRSYGPGPSPFRSKLRGDPPTDQVVTLADGVGGDVGTGSSWRIIRSIYYRDPPFGVSPFVDEKGWGDGANEDPGSERMVDPFSGGGVVVSVEMERMEGEVGHSFSRVSLVDFEEVSHSERQRDVL